MRRAAEIFMVLGLFFCLPAAGASGSRTVYGSEAQNFGGSDSEEAGTFQKETYRQEKREFDYGGDEIEADLKHMDFIVCTSEDDRFYLEYNAESKEEKNPLTVSIRDGVFLLEEKKAEPASWYKGVSIGGLEIITGKSNYKNVATLYVPSDRQVSLTANMGEGDLQVDGVSLKSADIVMEEGDLEMSDMTVQGAEITMSEGDLEMSGMTVQGAEITMDEGDLEMSDMTIQGAEITMSEGDLEMSDMTVEEAEIAMDEGDLEMLDMTVQGGTITMDAGDLEAENIKLAQNVRIQSTDGDISLGLNSSCRDTLSIFADTEMDMDVSGGIGGEITEKGGTTSYEKIVNGEDDKVSVTSECGDIMIDVE